MNYGAEAYENPPAPVAAGVEVPSSNILAADLDANDGLRNRRHSLPKKPKLTLRQAVFAQPHKNNGKMVNSASQLLDIVIYAAFVALIVYIAFAKNTSGSFYYSQKLITTFTKCPRKDGTDLVDVNVIDDVWDFVNNTVIRGLYWRQSNENISSEAAAVLLNNRLLGNPTIRMLKVRNDTCEVAPGFKREIKECFGWYKEDNEDQTTFGTDGRRFVWQSAEDLGTIWERGKQGDYGGGGFVVELPKSDLEQAYDTIEQLMKVRFIDRGTRAIFIDFSMFNPNVNLFCVARLLFELPPTGGVFAYVKFSPMDLVRYGDAYGTTIVIAEGLFVGFVVFFLLQEILEIARSRLGYFTDFWNIMDAIIVGLSISCCIVSYSTTKTCTDRINAIVSKVTTAATMDDVVNALNTYSNMSSILLFLTWIKVFKYISVNKTMSQLSQTLTRSAKDIGGFAVMFCVFFFAYAQFGYLVFGSQIEDYSSFVRAMLSLLRIILGDFDYVGLQNANRVLGPVFFVTYVFFVFFVLLNMFLAIINDSYVEVKGEMARKKNDISLMDWIRSTINRSVNGSTKGQKPEPPVDPLITYEEYKNELLKIGFKEQDILDAFTRVDVDENDEVTNLTMMKVNDEMSLIVRRKDELHNEFAENNRMNHRIEALESALGESARRLDTALEMLAESEDKRAEAMEQALMFKAKETLQHRPKAE